MKAIEKAFKEGWGTGQGDIREDMQAAWEESAAYAALAAQEQVPVEVAIKPLEWFGEGRSLFGATPFQKKFYAIYEVTTGNNVWKFQLRINSISVNHLFDQQRDAVVAAQADFEARIRSTLVASTPPAPVSSETVDIGECAEKIDGMLRKLEALRWAFNMKGANATTILRVVNTLATMRNTLVAALTPAQPLLAQEAVAKPFMYGIMEPDGTAYMDEVCVDLSPGTLEELIEEGEMEGYTVVPMYLAAPVPSPQDVKDGWQPIETAPRDGTKFLALNSEPVHRYDDSLITECTWSDYSDKQSGIYPCWMLPLVRSLNAQSVVFLTPKAWQPLPAAPQPQETE